MFSPRHSRFVVYEDWILKRHDATNTRLLPAFSCRALSGDLPDRAAPGIVIDEAQRAAVVELLPFIPHRTGAAALKMNGVGIT